MKAYKDLQDYKSFCAPRDAEKNLVTLKGILSGISIDNVVNETEIEELQNWCLVNESLNSTEPYKSVIATIQDAITDGVITNEEIEDICWGCENALTGIYDGTTQAIQELNGILHGILADNVISKVEIKQLQNWIYDHEQLKSTYPYDEIESIVLSILSDGIVTDEEQNILKAFIGQYIDTTVSLNINKPEIAKLSKDFHISGICAVDPEIILENRIFCFTGTSSHFRRSDIANKIERLGGIYIDSISAKTNYLIFGDGGSPCWAYTCYGRKIEQVMSNRKAGINTVIVHECDFWDTMQEYL